MKKEFTYELFKSKKRYVKERDNAFLKSVSYSDSLLNADFIKDKKLLDALISDLKEKSYYCNGSMLNKAIHNFIREQDFTGNHDFSPETGQKNTLGLCGLYILMVKAEYIDYGTCTLKDMVVSDETNHFFMLFMNRTIGLDQAKCYQIIAELLEAKKQGKMA
jgi:hypothetical protein